MTSPTYLYADMTVEPVEPDTLCLRLEAEGADPVELYIPARCAWSVAAGLMTAAAGAEMPARRVARRLFDKSSNPYDGDFSYGRHEEAE